MGEIIDGVLDVLTDEQFWQICQLDALNRTVSAAAIAVDTRLADLGAAAAGIERHAAETARQSARTADILERVNRRMDETNRLLSLRIGQAERHHMDDMRQRFNTWRSSTDDGRKYMAWRARAARTATLIEEFTKAMGDARAGDMRLAILSMAVKDPYGLMPDPEYRQPDPPAPMPLPNPGPEPANPTFAIGADAKHRRAEHDEWARKTMERARVDMLNRQAWQTWRASLPAWRRQADFDRARRRVERVRYLDACHDIADRTLPDPFSWAYTDPSDRYRTIRTIIDTELTGMPTSGQLPDPSMPMLASPAMLPGCAPTMRVALARIIERHRHDPGIRIAYDPDRRTDDDYTPLPPPVRLS